MLDNNESVNHHQNEDCSARDYLTRADAAAETGDIELAMHLYLVAFEHSQQSTFMPDDDVVNGLREAWVLACELGERSIAEYIFDKLEPYLSADETKLCTEELQKLALGKLEEIGISFDEINGIAKAAAHEILGTDNAPDVRIGRIEGPFPMPSDSMLDLLKKMREGAALPPSGDSSENQGEPKQDKTADAEEDASDLAIGEDETFTYSDIAGYETVVRDMRAIGIGLDSDPAFQDFVSLLNARHGLKRMPSLGSLLFCSPAREDAGEFMLATAGEIGYPAVRMRVEENMQGVPVLSVLAQVDSELRLNASRTAFEGRGTLVLEDIDLWFPPLPDAEEGFGAMLVAQLARAVREALNVIRTAVENPDIHVLASASSETEIPPIIFDLLDPFTCVDIDLPTAGERVDIWMHIVDRHPSLGQVDLRKLVRYSANMPRVDIYYAAREAIEEAYRQGIVAREYIPVTNELMLEKLANYHPLDSAEYKELEDYVASGFRRTLENDFTVGKLLGLEWDDESCSDEDCLDWSSDRAPKSSAEPESGEGTIMDAEETEGPGEAAASGDAHTDMSGEGA